MKELLLLMVPIYLNSLSAAQDQNNPQNNLKVEVIGPASPAPEPTPSPDDKIEVDKDTGDIVFEYRAPGGLLKRGSIELGNKVKPEINVNHEVLQDGLVKYTYTVKIMPEGTQKLLFMAIPVSSPILLADFSAPPTWRPRANVEKSWYSLWTDAPGQDSLVLTFTAPMLPGLVKLTLDGNCRPPEYNSEEMSAWMRAKLEAATRFENTTLGIHSIAPKIIIASTVRPEGLVDAIRAELGLAASLPEFKTYVQQIADVSSQLWLSGNAAAGSMAKILSEMGETPLQRTFFKAISFDLLYLEKAH